MRVSTIRIALLAVIFASASFALADQKIKTKSNIKNDRLAETSSAASADQNVVADTKVESKAVASQSSSSSAPSKAVP